MKSLTNSIDWIDSQQQRMTDLVVAWAGINSGSGNVHGLQQLAGVAAKEFDTLGAETLQENFPCVHLRKRPDAPIQIFFCIHLDTVFSAGDAFQKVTLLDRNRLQGPGVADAKGGIAVMLVALQTLEKSPWADQIGWEVLLNPDEEIGSPMSLPLLLSAAKRNHFGLLFEPALPNGTLVSTRKGSAVFTATVHGKAAHAGRDFYLGRNAIHTLADLVARVNALNDQAAGITASVGQIDGGTAANVVPNVATCKFNIRVDAPEQMPFIAEQVERIAAEMNRRDGIRVSIDGGFSSPPKTLDDSTKHLLDAIASCGRELGLPIQWGPSGGVSDGNKLAAAGLPNVDTLGVRGGNLHSHQEFLLLDSLPERAKLTAMLLLNVARGEIKLDLKPLHRHDMEVAQ